MKIDLYPSIIAFNTLDIGSEIFRFDNMASGFHIDIMDGQYVNNYSSFPMYMIEMVRKYTHKPIQIHAMMRIDTAIHDLVEFHPDIIFFHPNSSKSPEKIVNTLKNNSIKVGVALEDLKQIDKYKNACNMADEILFMTVKPGKSGQKCIQSKLEDLIKLRKLFPNKKIIVDGGMTSNIISSISAHIDGAVVGSGLYKSKFV